MSKVFEALQRSNAESTEVVSSLNPVIGELLNTAQGSNEIERCASLTSAVSARDRLVSITEADTLAAEKFRVLAVRLSRLKQTRKLQKILITSALPEEGKSVVAANLAATIARNQKNRVLLVDGDLRKPTARQRLGLPRVNGLTDFLRRGDLAMSEIIVRVEPGGFWLLSAGEPADNPLELLQSGKLTGLLESLTECFEWIIIDSAPVLPLADTNAWARVVDGIVLVVREGQTQKRQLMKALEILDRSHLLGVVLNNSNTIEHKGYYLYYGAAHSGSGNSKG